jgi:serine/threonine protein kinase
MKSDNILVQETGVCKITDFGISKKLDFMDRAHSKMKGTSYWMAPEIVATGSEGYDSKVDIWSLGCVVLEMWTAKRPWADEREIMPIIFKASNESKHVLQAADAKRYPVD